MKYVLGGFIDELAAAGYTTEFVRMFPHLRCERGSDNLVRYWSFGSRKEYVSHAEQNRVEQWHAGYRSALRQWRPANYS